MSTVPREPTLATLLVDAINSRLIEFRVSMPCKISKYNSSDGTVDVEVTLKDQKPQSDGTVELKDFPPIQDVPIRWQRCGKGWITLPLAAGDPGHLIFSDRSLSNWAASNKGEVVDPKSLSLHNFDGAIFEPGLVNTSSPIDSPDLENIVIHVMNKLMLGEKGLTDDNLVALAKLVKTELDNLRTALNSFITTYNSHTHPYVDTPSGAAVTSPTLSTGNPANPVQDVKATKVYAK